MKVIGHGIDLVDVTRFSRLFEKRGQRVLERCFTPAEQAYASARAGRRDEVLAARFAAKEAVVKALGTGLVEGMAWTEVEIATDASGRPSVRLHGKAQQLAAALGVAEWHLSMTHAGRFAMASVLAVG